MTCATESREGVPAMAKILLTDDEAHVRHVMKYKLQRAGHAVLTAVNGEDALERARHALPDLIVSDQQMPLMTGLELCRSLFAGATTRHKIGRASCRERV